MDWLTGTFSFILIWWVMIFAVLPFGIRRDDEPEVGHDIGAPKRADIRKKFIITTIVSVIIWAILFGIFEIGLIDYRTLVEG